MEDFHIFIKQNCIKLIVLHTNLSPNKFVVPCFILFILAFIFVSNTAKAQEKQDRHLEDTHGVVQSMSGHLMNVFGEMETSKDSTLIKSVPITIAKTEPSSNSTKPEEETLSFNFLYFIIQKFKVTDIVD